MSDLNNGGNRDDPSGGDEVEPLQVHQFGDPPAKRADNEGAGVENAPGKGEEDEKEPAGNGGAGVETALGKGEEGEKEPAGNGGAGGGKPTERGGGGGDQRSGNGGGAGDESPGNGDRDGDKPGAAWLEPLVIFQLVLMAAFVVFGSYFVFGSASQVPVWNLMWVLALIVALIIVLAFLARRRRSEGSSLRALERILPEIGNAITGTFGAVLIIGGLSFGIIWSVLRENKVMGNEFSRGLITVTFTFGTMLTAFVLVLTALFGNAAGPNQAVLKARFDMGKEVLGLLIGIFGTILGFYFGASTEDVGRRRVVSAIEMLGGEVDGATVYLNRPNVGDSNLADLRRLPKIERLRLDHSGVTDAGLVYLYDLKDLKELSLTGTKVHKEAVQALVDALKSDSTTLKVIPELNKLPAMPSAEAAPQGTNPSARVPPTSIVPTEPRDAKSGAQTPEARLPHQVPPTSNTPANPQVPKSAPGTSQASKPPQSIPNSPVPPKPSIPEPRPHILAVTGNAIVPPAIEIRADGGLD